MTYSAKGPAGAPNRLAQESSPYLQLHAHHAVDWFPWGEEALEKAEREQKPLLLSIGYSSCHWCHVMARESFEDPEIAAFLNAHFVSIKLDREERPDLDHLYMTAHQAMHEGRGGWPLNLFLTPQREPFFSGTYFPPQSREGRAGFQEILAGVWDAWSTKRGEVLQFGATLTAEIEQSNRESAHPTEELGKNFLSHARGLLLANGDTQNGGWGRGPKFPQAALLRFLLASPQQDERDFALMSLRKMAYSGLYDQVNGGFHRYCVDGQWIVPHFEKMLYDQAQLVEAYLDAYLQTGDPLYERIVRGTAAYLLRELQSPEGAFYCAQDAQSEGKEGKFCCWTTEELASILTPAQLTLAQRVYELPPEGNFFDFSDPEALQNQIVLTLKQAPETLSRSERQDFDRLQAVLFAVRARRVAPATDQKILLDWNALAIAALARASRHLSEPPFLEAAQNAFHSLQKTHQRGCDLYHSWKASTQDAGGPPSQVHGLNLGSDFVLFLRASRLLHEATLEPKYLERVDRVAPLLLEKFYDKENGGFYETEASPERIMRLKGELDAAVPALSSFALREFHLLALRTGDPHYQEVVSKTRAFYCATLQTRPHNLGEMLCSISENQDVSTLKLVGGEKQAFSSFLETAFAQQPRPLIYRQDPKQGRVSPAEPAAFLCRGETCYPPVYSASELAALFADLPAL